MPPDHRPPPARVVLLAGPSGSGKSYLARSVGLPIVALDDFYRADTDPAMPRDADGNVDWESPDSWDCDAAVAALADLCRTGRVDVPTYSFGENRAVGHRAIDRGDATIVVAEGIFAGEVIAPLERTGLLADALLIHQNRWVTFARRLLRDLREGRKAPWFLVRQGWLKTRAEPLVVARQCAQGARPVSKPQARERLVELADAADEHAAATPEAPAADVA